MKYFLDTILDVIFPSICISCKKRGPVLCLACILASPQAERESARWIFPLFDYRHPPMKKAIWFLKYRKKRNLAKVFAEVMYPRILEELSDLIKLNNFQEPILIPIPLSRKRERERGFNQSLLLSQNLIRLDKNLNFKLEKNILIKTKDTKHQAQIKNKNERLKNLFNSFKIKNEKVIIGKNIILIDDVTTTGATLNEAKKVLKEAGAKKIIAFTIAH